MQLRLGADHLTFEGGRGDVRKNILQTDIEGKISYKEFPGEKHATLKKKSLMAYNA